MGRAAGVLAAAARDLGIREGVAEDVGLLLAAFLIPQIHELKVKARGNG